MTTYPLGMTQAKYDKLKKKLIEKKTPPIVPVSLAPSSPPTVTVDTLDSTLDVHLDIHHIDVGQGESTLFALMCEDKCVCSVLIDGGLETAGGGMLMRLLQRLGIEHVDAVIISHFDADHFEGVTRVLTDYLSYDEVSGKAINSAASTWTSKKVYNIFLRQIPRTPAGSSYKYYVKNTEQVRALAEALEGYDSDSVHLVDVGDELALECDADKGLFKMTCLAVNGGGTGRGDDDENANSIAWLVTFGDYKYYTAGDLPSSAKNAPLEDALAAGIAGALGGKPLTAIKCGHHGADTSTSKAFLAAAKPQIAFISAGKYDSFGHPRGSTLLRLHEAASVKLIALTNCVYNRPLVHDDYEAFAVQDLQSYLNEAAWAVAFLRDAIPDTSGMVGKNDAATSHLEHLVTMRGELTAIAATALEGPSETIKLGTALSGAELDEIISSVSKVAAFTKGDHGSVLGSLNRGIKLESGGVVQEDVRQERHVADALRRVRAAAVQASELKAAREGLAPRRGDLGVLVAGGSGHMGNIVLRMNLSDADQDQRVAFLGLWYKGAWRWAYLTFGGMDASTIELPKDNFISSVDVAELKMYQDPGSPSMDVGSSKRSFNDFVGGDRVGARGDGYITDYSAIFDEQDLKRKKLDP